MCIDYMFATTHAQIYYGWTKGMLAFLERMGEKGAPVHELRGVDRTDCTPRTRHVKTV